MPTQTFYLDKDSDESIVISYGFNFKNLTIIKDGEVIGQFKNQKELKEAASFPLDDNRILSVQLTKKLGFITVLELLVNGTPVPGSASDPNVRLKSAYHLLIFLAAINIVLGIIAELSQNEFLLDLGMGYVTVILGSFFGLFAYLVKFKLSLISVYSAIGLILFDIFASVVYASEIQGNAGSGWFIKMIFIFILLNSISAIKQLRDCNSHVLEEAI